MKKTILAFPLIVFSMIFLFSCEESRKTDVVESGTYTGIADEVDADEKEIYVKTPDDKVLELYFTDQTQLTQNGQPVDFSALQKGQQLEVEVEKKGQRLEPVSVKILTQNE